jgi:hypothetical protein
MSIPLKGRAKFNSCRIRYPYPQNFDIGVDSHDMVYCCPQAVSETAPLQNFQWKHLMACDLCASGRVCPVKAHQIK